MKISRSTHSKSIISSLIEKSKAALSASEIQLRINDLCDKVTTYRILERLQKEGKIHKIVNIDGIIKYANCSICFVEHKHNHLHFNCESCKKVTCLNGIEPTFLLPSNYKVYDVNFTLSGICPQCI